MKDLERENVRLKRLVADLSLEKQVLKAQECVVAREDSNLQPDRYERYALPGKADKI